MLITPIDLFHYVQIHIWYVVLLWIGHKLLKAIVKNYNAFRGALIDKHYKQAHKKPVVMCFEGDCHKLSSN